MPRVVKHAHTKLLPCKSNIGEVNRSSGRFIKGKTYPSDLRQISTFEIYQGNTDALLNGMQLVSSPDGPLKSAYVFRHTGSERCHLPRYRK